MKLLLSFLVILLTSFTSPSPISLSHSSLHRHETKDVTVYITNTGAKYHRGGCRYLRQSKISIPKKEAIASGYDPCSVCRP